MQNRRETSISSGCFVGNLTGVPFKICLSILPSPNGEYCPRLREKFGYMGAQNFAVNCFGKFSKLRLEQNIE